MDQDGYQSASPHASDTESDHEGGQNYTNFQAPDTSRNPSEEVKSLVCLSRVSQMQSPGQTGVTAILETSESNFLVYFTATQLDLYGKIMVVSESQQTLELGQYAVGND
jgi:hypothetical protein